MRKIKFDTPNGWEVEEGKVIFSFLSAKIIEIKSDSIFYLKYWVKFTSWQYRIPSSGKAEELSLKNVFMYWHFEDFKSALYFVFKTKIGNWKGKIKENILRVLAKYELIQLKNFR